MLLQPLGKLVLIAEYQLNKGYIAAFLCQNKTKTYLKCEGKCHLAKELKKADKTDQKLPSPLKEKVEHLLFWQAVPTFSFHFATVSDPEFPAFVSPISSPPVFGIFHPPRFLV